MENERDPHYYSHTRVDLIHLIPPGTKKILEVGCGAGMTGKALREKGFEKIVGIVRDAVRSQDRHLFNAFTATRDSNIHTASPLTIVVALYFYPLLALAGAGVVLTWREWRRYAPLVLLVLAWAGLHGILTSCTRFRLPIDPILFLLAATAIVRILGSRRPRAV